MKQHNSIHFIVYYKSQSLAEKDINQIVVEIENNYNLVIQKLKLPEENRMIKYFLYPSNKIKFEAMGDDGNGNALKDKFEIHEVYNEKIKLLGPHEMTHLLTTQLGMPVELLRQGVAEAMEEDWAGRNHNDIVAEFLKEDKYIPLTILIDDNEFWSDKYNDNLTYPIAGSFSKYLLKKYGLNKFKELYAHLVQFGDKRENIEKFEEIMGKKLEDVEKEWLAGLT